MTNHRSKQTGAVIAALWHRTDAATKLYAVLDTARDKHIYPHIQELGGHYRSPLFMGELGRALRGSEPWLVELKQRSNFIRWLVREGWGQCWGIFMESPADLLELSGYCRKLLMVRALPLAPALHFRFYDPRVWRSFMTEPRPESLPEMFGPVLRFHLEDETGEYLITHEPGEGELLAKKERVVP